MKRARVYIYALSLINLLAACGPAAAEVIISEIMYNPTGTETGREWVELYNNGAAAVDLSGWQFGDAQDNTWASAFPAGTSIGAQQALIVTGDSSLFDLGWGTGINRIQVSSFPNLANAPAAVDEAPAIRNAAGVIQDRVAYDDANGWPRINGSNGQSIVLSPGSLTGTGNDIGLNWKPGMRGVYGGVYKGTDGDNQGSPGVVSTTPQTPFLPSPDAVWSMVYLPDTQNYSKSAVDNVIMTQQTTWIRDHRDEYKIKVMIQGGDIVNNNNTNNPTGANDVVSSQQWANAKASISVLDGQVPYILAAGNHDFGFTNSDNRDTMINNYFKAEDNPLNDPAHGGILKGVMVPGEIQNAYYAFTAPDGRKMLIFALEWQPRPATVTWANQIAALPEYADYTASLLTHDYLQGNNTRSTSSKVEEDAEGQVLWDNLVKTHENFQMVFNGHFGGDGSGTLRSTANAGNAVEQMFFNTQFETFGGGGWLRVLEFLNDGTTVRVRTYSPFYNLYRTGSDYEFTFQLDALPAVAGDYNGNGVVDAADYVVWRNQTGQFGPGLAADGNEDNQVNVTDWGIWHRNFGLPFGAGAGAEATSVPEASCLVLLSIAAAISCCGRGRRRSG
jgi:hypothetical protein